MKAEKPNQDILYTIGFNQFCKEIAQKTGQPRSKSDVVVRAVFESIRHNLYNQTAVRVPNFGVFYARQYPAHLLKSPSGVTYWVGDQLVPKVRYSKNFRLELKSKKKLRRKNDN